MLDSEKCWFLIGGCAVGQSLAICQIKRTGTTWGFFCCSQVLKYVVIVKAFKKQPAWSPWSENDKIKRSYDFLKSQLKETNLTHYSSWAVGESYDVCHILIYWIKSFVFFPAYQQLQGHCCDLLIPEPRQQDRLIGACLKPESDWRCTTMFVWGLWENLS